MLTVFVILKNRMKSIGEMLDAKGVVALVFKDQDDVKTRFVLDKIRALINVYQSCLGDVISFSTSDRLQGSIYRVIAAGLYLDENEVRVVVNNDVNFSIFGSEILAQQLIPFAYQVFSGKFLASAGKLIR